MKGNDRAWLGAVGVLLLGAILVTAVWPSGEDPDHDANVRQAIRQHDTELIASEATKCRDEQASPLDAEGVGLDEVAPRVRSSFESSLPAAYPEQTLDFKALTPSRPELGAAIALPGFGASEDMRSDALRGLAGDEELQSIELEGVAADQLVAPQQTTIAVTQGCYLTLVVGQSPPFAEALALTLVRVADDS